MDQRKALLSTFTDVKNKAAPPAPPATELELTPTPAETKKRKSAPKPPVTPEVAPPASLPRAPKKRKAAPVEPVEESEEEPEDEPDESEDEDYQESSDEASEESSGEETPEEEEAEDVVEAPRPAKAAAPKRPRVSKPPAAPPTWIPAAPEGTVGRMQHDLFPASLLGSLRKWVVSAVGNGKRMHQREFSLILAHRVNEMMAELEALASTHGGRSEHISQRQVAQKMDQWLIASVPLLGDDQVEAYIKLLLEDDSQGRVAHMDFPFLQKTPFSLGAIPAFRESLLRRLQSREGILPHMWEHLVRMISVFDAV